MAKTVLITGAGSGIGKALAFRLAAAGLNVVICGRRADVLNEVANAPEACNKIRVVVADVASAEGCDALKKALGETPLDILVHNAGVFTVAQLETVDRDTWRKCMAVNAEAPIFLTQALSANLKAAETKARVLIIGSGAADINIPTMNVYCGSKALVKHIWKSLNMDMGTVADFAYCKVGLVESDMTGSMPGNDDLLIKDTISDRLRSGDVHPADEVAGWLENLFEPKLVDAEAFKTREHDIDNPAHQLGMKIRLTTEGKAFLGQETCEQNTCFLAKMFGRR
eukprot:TRINITY_DN3152_c0_g1_i1.p1 TRINITY_DN3152_c0_g1~~TRINITY_DN3152_c0_g1_i1.p1  ORF type:complete len:282 (+),score=59.98 TRINITY_DN3152_c0_g1_i1:88-933(+)